MRKVADFVYTRSLMYWYDLVTLADNLTVPLKLNCYFTYFSPSRLNRLCGSGFQSIVSGCHDILVGSLLNIGTNSSKVTFAQTP